MRNKFISLCIIQHSCGPLRTLFLYLQSVSVLQVRLAVLDIELLPFFLLQVTFAFLPSAPTKQQQKVGDYFFFCHRNISNG